MRNFWIIFKDEYTKRVGKRSFLISTIGIPLAMAVVIGVIILVATNASGEKPLGYVDQSGLIQGEVRPSGNQQDSSVVILRFASEDQARSALQSGQIQSYYVIPPNYLQTRSLDRYDWQSNPTEVVQSEFAGFLRSNLASSLSPEVQQLFAQGPLLMVRSMDGSREISSGNVAGILVPLVAGFLFFFSTMASAGYLLQVVADEKENRTMEILMTSISPNQFISGKALSLMAVTLTQLTIWVTIAVIGLVIGSRYMPQLQNIQIPADYLSILLLFYLPSFALIAGLMISIGAAVTEMRQGQQIAGILNLAFVLPFFFITVIMTAPDSPLMTILTLFPTTAFITVSLRLGLSTVPTLQLVLSWLILVISATASVWAATRIFRLGMLRYGQQLSLSAALSVLQFHKEPRVRLGD